jgi:hypothetical protein
MVLQYSVVLSRKKYVSSVFLHKVILMVPIFKRDQIRCGRDFWVKYFRVDLDKAERIYPFSDSTQKSFRRTLSHCRKDLPLDWVNAEREYSKEYEIPFRADSVSGEIISTMTAHTANDFFATKYNWNLYLSWVSKFKQNFTKRNKQWPIKPCLGPFKDTYSII